MQLRFVCVRAKSMLSLPSYRPDVFREREGLFQITQHIRDGIQDITCHHRRSSS